MALVWARESMLALRQTDCRSNNLLVDKFNVSWRTYLDAYAVAI